MSRRPVRLGISLGFLSALRLVINTATRFVSFFLPAIARGLGVPLARAGDLVSLRWAAGLPTPLVVSALSRGRPRRNLIGLSISLFALGALVTAVSSVFTGAVVGFIAMGVAKPLFDVSAQAYVADRVEYSRRGRYLGTFELTWAGGLLIGAPLAGWLIRRSGWAAPFWVIGLLLGVGLMFLLRFLEPDTGDLDGSAGRLELDRPSLALLITAGLYAAAAELMFVVLGAWLEDSFGMSLVAAGGIAVFIGIAELLGEGATTAFSDHVGKRRSVAAGIVIAAAGFAVFAAVAGSLAGGVFATMVAYFGFELTIVSSIPYASEIHPHARARFLAWLVVGLAIGRTFGSALGPRLYTGWGVEAAALGALLLNLVGLGVFVAGGVPEGADDRRNVANSRDRKEGTQ